MEVTGVADDSPDWITVTSVTSGSFGLVPASYVDMGEGEGEGSSLDEGDAEEESPDAVSSKGKSIVHGNGSTEGWLTKKPEGMLGRPRTRWFVLSADGNTLSYFVDTVDASGKPKGTIAASSATLEKEPDQFTFHLIDGKRKFTLAAGSPELYQMWVDALQPPAPAPAAAKKEAAVVKRKPRRSVARIKEQKLGSGTVVFDFKPQPGETHQLGVSAGKGAIDRPKTMGCSSGGAWGNAATLV